jgi:hypothetical protein
MTPSGSAADATTCHARAGIRRGTRRFSFAGRCVAGVPGALCCACMHNRHEWRGRLAFVTAPVSGSVLCEQAPAAPTSRPPGSQTIGPGLPTAGTCESAQGRARPTKTAWGRVRRRGAQRPIRDCWRRIAAQIPPSSTRRTGTPSGSRSAPSRAFLPATKPAVKGSTTSRRCPPKTRKNRWVWDGGGALTGDPNQGIRSG